ncbi:MAG: 16S rRNA (uracil(1498)-N(3))-methyltransferase [Coriobacteriia bacterium]|nr:16S rRNA (uracil(1498)-N(3))-methyltransferase [Coriobacteriia bacterium]
MSLHRFFAEEPLPENDGVLPLGEADIHHLRDVLRLSPGDEIVVVVAGAARVVRLTHVSEVVSGVVLEEVPTPALPRVTLVQALVKGEKMDTVIRQATELGVTRVVPFAAERSVVRLDAAKAEARVARWRRVAAEAAKQSQRTDIPEVTTPVPAAKVAEIPTADVVLVCWEGGSAAPGIGDALSTAGAGAGTSVAVIVGPEGGLTPGEVDLFRSGGARVVSLGSTVLRTETAGVVATALVLYELGGLGARHE